MTEHIIREGFFAFREDIGQAGEGFSLFGVTHLVALVVLAAIVAALCAFYKRLQQRGRRRMLLGLSLTIIAMEVVKQASMFALHGAYFAYLLPLHLCGLSIFIEFIHALKPNKTTGEILYSLCLPGAVAALMFCNWTMYPVLNFYCLQSFVIHALHIAFPLMILLTGELRPKFSNLWRPALFLVIVAPVLYAVNTRLGTNFLFINAGSEGSPLEIFVNIFGSPLFLLPYAGLVAAVWCVMYLPWFLADRAKRADGR